MTSFEIRRLWTEGGQQDLALTPPWTWLGLRGVWKGQATQERTTHGAGNASRTHEGNKDDEWTHELDSGLRICTRGLRNVVCHQMMRTGEAVTVLIWPHNSIKQNRFGLSLGSFVGWPACGGEAHLRWYPLLMMMSSMLTRRPRCKLKQKRYKPCEWNKQISW